MLNEGVLNSRCFHGFLLALSADACAPPTQSPGTPAQSLATRSEPTPEASRPRTRTTEVRVAPLTLKLKASLDIDAFGLRLEYLSALSSPLDGSPDKAQASSNEREIVLSMRLNGRSFSLVDAPAGYESETTAWADRFKIELVDYSPDLGEVRVRVWKITELKRTSLFRQHVLKIGKRLAIEPGLDLQIDGHSHKKTHPGQRSPLLVEASMMVGSQIIHHSSLHLYPPEEVTWTYRDYRFEMVDYQYKDGMTLNVDTLVLEAVITEGRAARAER